jgi:hypothetical protein
MKLALTVLVLLAGAATSILALQTPGCDGARTTVLECIQQLFDLDHNGEITPVEAAVALGGQTFTDVPAGLTWQFVMQCDLDEDGVLTMADWEQVPPNATCLPTQNCLDIACDVCARNGFVQSKRRDSAPASSTVTKENQQLLDRQAAAAALLKKTLEKQELVRARIRKAHEDAERMKKAAPACLYWEYMHTMHGHSPYKTLVTR